MRLPVLFIFFTVVLDSMGIGIIMPVMPDLLQEVGNADLSGAAKWGGLLTVVFAVNQFLFSPVIGGLSDAYGRRPVLLLSLLVLTLDYLVMALAGSLWLLFLARIVGGITSATQSAANAYMADISSADEKAKNFGLLGAAFGVGFILGPLLGGLLAEYGSRAPFYGAAALAFINMLFGYFVLPESNKPANRRPFNWQRANPFGAFKQMRGQSHLVYLLAVYFLLNVAVFVYPSVWAYFCRAQFSWDAKLVGLSLASYGFGIVVVQGFLIRPILRRLGDVKTAAFGLFIHLLSFAVYPFMTQTWHVFAGLPIAVFSAVAVPALQGLMSNRVADDQQGELQGVMGSLMALATILSPFLMTQSFSFFTRDGASPYLPGAPFILSAAFVLVAIMLLKKGLGRTG